MPALDIHRPKIDPWVALQYQGSTHAATGGQRLVYELPNHGAALKIWPAVQGEQAERNVREIDALADLDHPSLPRIIARLTDVELAGTAFTYYLEQWLDAPSLLLSNGTGDLPLDPDRFNRVALTAAEAVEALHAAGVIHRDISLGNVLADRDRGYVIDLGLAKHLDLETLTATGVHVGRTPNTASLEQLAGNPSDVTTCTDIFSLGVVLTMALTGNHPFRDPGETPEQSTYVERLRSHDTRHLPADETGGLLRDMLHPSHLYRPSASEVVAVLS